MKTLYRCGHCNVRATSWEEMQRHAVNAHSAPDDINAYIQVEDPDGSTRWVATNDKGEPWTKGMLSAPIDEPPPTEGRKDDQSKNRLDLIPPELIFAVGDILTFGAAKYADRNWERGMAWSRVFGALMRHMWAWWAGAAPTSKSFVFGDLDMETGKSHLWHAGCCIAFLIAYEERGTGTDDRWTGTQPTERKEPPPTDWTVRKS
jgi:hypothetical protein